MSDIPMVVGQKIGSTVVRLAQLAAPGLRPDSSAANWVVFMSKLIELDPEERSVKESPGPLGGVNVEKVLVVFA